MGKIEKSSTERCAKCGACTVVCPVFKASGQECYTARGKNHLLEVFSTQDRTRVFEDIFSKCLLCGACNTVCPRGLDITGRVEEVRSTFASIYGSHGFEKYLARKVLEQPKMLHGARFMGNVTAKMLLNLLPIESGLRLKLAMFDGDFTDIPGIQTTGFERYKKSSPQQVVYFPGCSARYLYPKMVDVTAALMNKLGFSMQLPDGLGCCGLAFKAAGDKEQARKSAIHNIALLSVTTGPVLVTCGSCWAQLKKYPELVQDDSVLKEQAEDIVDRLVEISTFLEDNVTVLRKRQKAAPQSVRVFYHDPCHLRNGNDVTQQPRNVLNSLEHVSLVELVDGPQCCGQGGLFHLGAPDIAAAIRDDLVQKVLDLQPDVITTNCSGCYMQWKSGLAAAGEAASKIKLQFFTELVNGQIAD
jgi:glycolate oxidase iron-sulfur subunit